MTRDKYFALVLPVAAVTMIVASVVIMAAPKQAEQAPPLRIMIEERIYWTHGYAAAVGRGLDRPEEYADRLVLELRRRR